nr:MAG TPA: hypothetical protein [Caudoviricetes sp.]
MPLYIHAYTYRHFKSLVNKWLKAFIARIQITRYIFY